MGILQIPGLRLRTSFRDVFISGEDYIDAVYSYKSLKQDLSATLKLITLSHVGNAPIKESVSVLVLAIRSGTKLKLSLYLPVAVSHFLISFN